MGRLARGCKTRQVSHGVALEDRLLPCRRDERRGPVRRVEAELYDPAEGVCDALDPALRIVGEEILPVSSVLDAVKPALPIEVRELWASVPAGAALSGGRQRPGRCRRPGLPATSWLSCGLRGRRPAGTSGR